MKFISFDEFMKVDLRVGKVIKAEKVPNTKSLIKLRVDLGEEERQLVAGLAEYYSPEELVGKNIVVVFNLQPKKIRGIMSQGMLLATDTEPPKLLTVEGDVPPGSKVR
ncbi:MAG: methionine--tRNA ligase subunit beta [Candidatus Asgardarchaeia archaeon]